MFSATAYRGNALAVVHDAEGLSTADMQQFANWTNLAETTFLLAPTDPRADYRVRIFTASEELPLPDTPHWDPSRPGWQPAEQWAPTV